jgi:hypothetical protein
MRFLTIGVICCFAMVSLACAQKEGEQEMVTVTGNLARIVAIGGETTG